MMGKETIKIAVFDLNETLYTKSSKDEFFKFVAKKKKHKAFNIFTQWKYHFLKKIKIISNTEFKENFFNYLDNITPLKVKEYAEEFWNEEYPSAFNQNLLNRIKDLKKQNVVIYCATGALEIYLEPLEKMLPLDGWMGTRASYRNDTYLIEGKACNGEEKIRRIEEKLNGSSYKIIEAYSDQKEKILENAETAFLVKDGVVEKLS